MVTAIHARLASAVHPSPRAGWTDEEIHKLKAQGVRPRSGGALAPDGRPGGTDRDGRPARQPPRFTIVMGCDGAGKSAWKRANRDRLPERYLDEDVIADGIGGWETSSAWERAAQLVEAEIAAAIAGRHSFGVEGSFADKAGPALVERAVQADHRIEGVYIGTSSPDVNIAPDPPPRRPPDRARRRLRVGAPAAPRRMAQPARDHRPVRRARHPGQQRRRQPRHPRGPDHRPGPRARPHPSVPASTYERICTITDQSPRLDDAQTAPSRTVTLPLKKLPKMGGRLRSPRATFSRRRDARGFGCAARLRQRIPHPPTRLRPLRVQTAAAPTLD